MRLAGAILLGLLGGAQLGCGGEECGQESVIVTFDPSPNARGLYLADAVTDRCGGDGSEEVVYEVECEGNCPAFTARVFLDAYMIAEEPSTAPYAEIVTHESHTPDINEYQLYVETDPDVAPESYTLVGRFTGARAQLVP